MPKSLPKEALSLWENVYDSAKKNGDDEELAAKKAWGALKRAGWSKGEDGIWHKKAELQEFSLRITKAVFDEPTQEMRWRADASDVDPDSYKDSMSHELFQDFISRIERNESAPDEYKSKAWFGGMPYLSVSHYPDLDGNGIPGPVDSVYIDGKFLKAKGRYSDTPLGRACFSAVCKDMHSENQNKIRISIAFLDWAHKHKSNGFEFEREGLNDFCPECLREIIKGSGEGKVYLKGQLVHLAHTRVPVNTRTLMEVEKAMTTRKEDAASIIGSELAEKLDEEALMVGKSEALVIKSKKNEEEETMEEEAEKKEEEQEDEAEEDNNVKKKSDISSDPRLDDVITKLDQVLLSLSSAVKSESTNVHPLDESVSILKSEFDRVISSSLTNEEKLMEIQNSYSDLGNRVIELVKSRLPQPAEEQKSETSDLAKALMAINQKMDLVTAKIDELEKKSVAVVENSNQVPIRRSIQPSQDLISRMQRKDAPKSETPNLRSIIDRTT